MKKAMVLLLAVTLVLVLFLPTLAMMQEVDDLFRAGRYDEARQQLDSSSAADQAPDSFLWQSRLTDSPSEALSLLEENLKDSSLPESTRQGMVLQMAQIHFARGEYSKAHTAIQKLLAASTTRIPGEVYLLAGLIERTSGNLQSAREMLASVKPEDPAFGAARYYLGDIGLESNDPELALRYFESGMKNAPLEQRSRLVAGKWRALRLNGQDSRADELLRQLRNNSPNCLALVEINRVLQTEEDDNSARLASENPIDPEAVVSTPEDKTSRFSLQLGAFSDRSLALEFKAKHQRQIKDLVITEVRDQRGQFLYKVRFGSFVNPAKARSEAKRQKKELGMDVIVVELGPNGSDR